MNDNFPDEDDLCDSIDMVEQHDQEIAHLNEIIRRQKRTIDALNRVVFTSDLGYRALSKALEIVATRLTEPYRENVHKILREYAEARPNIVGAAQRITSEPQITRGSDH